MPSGSSAQQSERRDRAKGEVEIARPQKITFGEMRNIGSVACSSTAPTIVAATAWR
jgi:hypothetical protein